MSMSLHNFLNLTWSLRLTSMFTIVNCQLQVTNIQSTNTTGWEHTKKTQLLAQYFWDLCDFKIQNLVKSHQNSASVPGWTEQELLISLLPPNFSETLII